MSRPAVHFRCPSIEAIDSSTTKSRRCIAPCVVRGIHTHRYAANIRVTDVCHAVIVARVNTTICKCLISVVVTITTLPTRGATYHTIILIKCAVGPTQISNTNAIHGWNT